MQVDVLATSRLVYLNIILILTSFSGVPINFV